MKKRRVFDRAGGPETFRKTACTGGPVELSYAKGSVQEAAHELGLDSSRITKWRRSAAAADSQKPWPIRHYCQRADSGAATD